MSAFAVHFSFASYLLSLLSYGSGTIAKKKSLQWIGFALICWAFVVQSIYWVWRWKQGSYGRMLNMHESLLLLVWLIPLFYSIFFANFFLTDRKFLLLGMGFWVAFLCLILLGIARLHDRTIQSLVPALQSNWFLFHVTITMAGYASLAFGFLLSGVYLVCFRKKPEAEKSVAFDAILQRAVTLGFLFLTAGIILGSVWANSAWGSYWSWDSKEKWALITWFFYAVALYLRKARGWRNEKFAWLSFAGFVFVLFTYFGVNYLISGLYSYA